MINPRKLTLSFIAITLLALTACGTAGSMLPQPQTHSQAVTRTPQDDTPTHPK